jgi:hypothetical protein
LDETFLGPAGYRIYVKKSNDPWNGYKRLSTLMKPVELFEAAAVLNSNPVIQWPR